MKIEECKICVLGLGYVGLPLAVAFAKKYNVVGFDINHSRVNELKLGEDSTLEIENQILLSVLKNTDSIENGLFISSERESISNSNVFIVTVPTPIDKYKRPVLTPMVEATKIIASALKKGNIVIYESTVYPGVTEDEMVPILEKYSGLKFNVDFYCGYSPERINPGDKKHTFTQIVKVTSGSTPQIADFVDQLYNSVIQAGTYKASSIKVAEAAKVIENSQRDINIAFVNELSKIFNLIGIDTNEVLEAAATKWNFLNFKPGLVGGHCIGVDPYYLAQKAQELGYHPEIILAGRRMNDSMGKYVATEVVKLMMRNDLKVIDSKALILGFTFKENCPDVRNTRVVDIYNELRNFDIQVDIYDPLANPKEVEEEYGVNFISGKISQELYSAVILAVAHDDFVSMDIKNFLQKGGIVFDVKGVLSKEIIDARL